jgi:hypothetical protein
MPLADRRKVVKVKSYNNRAGCGGIHSTQEAKAGPHEFVASLRHILISRSA